MSALVTHVGCLKALRSAILATFNKASESDQRSFILWLSSRSTSDISADFRLELLQRTTAIQNEKGKKFYVQIGIVRAAMTMAYLQLSQKLQDETNGRKLALDLKMMRNIIRDKVRYL